jgi:hypothetical protein
MKIRVLRKAIVTILLAFGLLVPASLAAQEGPSHRFLDGFTFTLEEGWEIFIISETGGAEETVEIVNPDGQSVYGFFYYGPDIPLSEFKADAVAAARELFIDEEDLKKDEHIIIEYGELAGGIAAYWVSLNLGDEAHSVVGIDLKRSPGNAQAVYFAFPPFFGLSLDTQLDILADLVNTLTVEFASAAG